MRQFYASRLKRRPEHFKGHTGVTGLSYGTHCVPFLGGLATITGNILTYTELRDFIRGTFTRLALKGHACRNLLRDIRDFIAFLPNLNRYGQNLHQI